MEKAEVKLRYSREELNEFEEILRNKLENAYNELNYIKSTLNRSIDNGTGASSGNVKVLEDGADTAEKESLNQLAARQQKFIKNLNDALVRIKNGTYGICVDSGKLIPKERLRAVPHTMHTIEAKLKKQG
ncbi:molecular chaperone DnaK [Fulvitalea axinellae]|uniref:Molecular chaperone DnaK n=1 Tax=Fulvitalea axinellae TaxID=1182444 RepID=A0AAU9CIS5_9BACT|nr:molecular chaperone DnaK [Fulvitalea axinellae]